MNRLILFLSVFIVSLLRFNNCNCQDSTFYQIINDLIKDSSLKTDLVIAEINVVHKYSELLNDSAKHDGQIKPPEYGAIYYEREYFQNLSKSGLIQNEDIDYMYNQIKGIYGLKLDSSRINKRVLPIRTWLHLNEKSVKKLSFIFFSDPIYSKNKESVLLTIRINDGSKLQEKTLLIKSTNRKWIISKVISEKNI